LIGDCFVPYNDAFEEKDDKLQRLYIIMKQIQGFLLVRS
ncbi:MAG: hypothetical protein JWQ57_2830, partial [Mucilaginibacter sp.]|nr:hypothetical protein [Mucilaginibacter sp.]